MQPRSNELAKIACTGDLAKGSTPSTPDDRRVMGLPLSKLQEVIDASPHHLRVPGQMALDKAIEGERTGNSRLMAEADREMANVIAGAVEIVRNREFARLLPACRRTVAR